MLRKLIHTTNDPIPTAARLVLGLVMMPHALQKLLGLFGGYGLNGTFGYMTGMLGMPGWLAGVALAAEILGAFGLVFGFLGRGAALGIAAVMIGAVATVHAKVGFFMNWGGVEGRGEGWEFAALALVLATIVMIRGSGAWSLDLLLNRKAA